MLNYVSVSATFSFRPLISKSISVWYVYFLSEFLKISSSYCIYSAIHSLSSYFSAVTNEHNVSSKCSKISKGFTRMTFSSVSGISILGWQNRFLFNWTRSNFFPSTIYLHILKNCSRVSYCLSSNSSNSYYTISSAFKSVYSWLFRP